MHLSTSNSNERLPKDAYGRMWILALALVLVTAIGMEAFFRAKGYQPSVRDDTMLWALVRSSMPKDDPGVVALVGSSRMLCDISVDAFQSAYGVKPAQLALIRSSPIPVLEDLADDEHFKGLILCEMSPALFFSTDSEYLGIAKQAVAKRKAMDDALFDYSETTGLVFLQSHLVSQSDQFQMEELIPSLLKGKLPEAPHRFRGDRARFFDTSKINKRLPDIPLPDASPRGIEMTAVEKGILGEVKEYVERIRARGGDVVFIYLPCRGDNKVDEILHYPRYAYWDVVLRETGCFGINSDDYASLSRFRPEYDYSHLDYRDAQEFTRGVAQILKGKYNR